MCLFVDFGLTGVLACVNCLLVLIVVVLGYMVLLFFGFVFELRLMRFLLVCLYSCCYIVGLLVCVSLAVCVGLRCAGLTWLLEYLWFCAGLGLRCLRGLLFVFEYVL